MVFPVGTANNSCYFHIWSNHMAPWSLYCAMRLIMNFCGLSHTLPVFSSPHTCPFPTSQCSTLSALDSLGTRTQSVMTMSSNFSILWEITPFLRFYHISVFHAEGGDSREFPTPSPNFLPPESWIKIPYETLYMVLTILRQGDQLHDTSGASDRTGGHGQTGMGRRGGRRQPGAASRSQSDLTLTTS